MMGGERAFAPCRHIIPSADIGPIDPDANRCLQRGTRAVLRPRPPHPAARLAFIARIAFRPADKSELSRIDSLQFIFTAPTFTPNGATDRLTKERREFFIPKARRESGLYGTEFEIQLRNKLTQRAVARECADWIRKKAKFRSNGTKAPMQQFMRASHVPSAAPWLSPEIMIMRRMPMAWSRSIVARAASRGVSIKPMAPRS